MSSGNLHTPLCDLLGCEVPVLLAGMGGVARWELAAAVANAGGYATLGMVREVIAHEDGLPRLRFSTDSPLRSTTGDLEAMALFAGQSVGAIHEVIPAAERIRQIMEDAASRIDALASLLTSQGGQS